MNNIIEYAESTELDQQQRNSDRSILFDCRVHQESEHPEIESIAVGHRGSILGGWGMTTVQISKWMSRGV